jgi:hypothetical protein
MMSFMPLPVFMQQYYKNNESNGQDSGSQKTPKNQNPGTSRISQAGNITTPDPNITISADPVVMKRGRVEYGSTKNSKKSRQDKTDSNTIANVESDESLDIDLDELQATPRPQKNQAHVIRCTPGRSRFQAPETPKSSRSVFRFRNSRKDLDETISADPAIKKRGPAQDFNDMYLHRRL